MKMFNQIFAVAKTAVENFVAWIKKVAVLREGHWRWTAGDIRKIIFEFDTSDKGMIILDQLGFSY